MEKIKLSISQMASMLSENVHTVRNWVRDFRDLLPIEKDERGYNLFNEDAYAMMCRIKKMYREQKLTTKQIRAILSGAAPHPADKVDAVDLIDLIAEIKEIQQQQQDINREILDRLDKLQGRSWLKRWFKK